MQVLTNNLGHKRPMNVCLPWYLTDRLMWVCGLSSWLRIKSLLSQLFLQCGHKFMVKINKQNKSDTENLIYNQHGERLAILNTENTKICGWITKLEAMKKMQCVCVFFHICRKFEFLVSQGRVGWLVGWSLTSLFSTNTAISETKGQGWTVIMLPSEGRLAIY